jgi:hypothetical protein
MLTAIDGMITELRQIGVPVSLTEKLDAVRSLRHLPLADREGLKAALRAALVKSHDHELAFDTLFDLYFSPSAGPVAGPGPAGRDGRDGPAGAGPGSFGSLDDAGLTELLLAALRDGNDVMLRLIAGIFVERHAAIEPGRPVAGTYYVFRTLRAVDPDRLIARLVAAGQEARSRLCCGGCRPKATRPRCSGSGRPSRRRSGCAWWQTAAPRPWPVPCAARCRRTPSS